MNSVLTKPPLSPVSASTSPLGDSHQFRDGRILRKAAAGLCRYCREPRFRYIAPDGTEVIPGVVVGPDGASTTSMCELCRAHESIDLALPNAIFLAPLNPRPDRLFDPGTVHSQKLNWWFAGHSSALQAIPPAELWKMINEHCSGRHGAIEAPDNRDIEDALVAPELAAHLARNVVAIEAGTGIVRSRHPFPIEFVDRLAPKQVATDPATGKKAPRFAVEIMTVLSSNRSHRTLCSFVITEPTF